MEMKQRSFSGPLLLIAAGAIWLLISLNVIPAANLWALLKLIPYLLIAFGLALLVRSRWALGGQVISALVILGAALAVYFAPQLGWDQPTSWILSAGYPGGVQGSGKVVTESRKVSGFNEISLDFPAQYTIEQADTPSVKIEADDNLIPQIRTEVRSGTLVIENRETNWDVRVDPSSPVKITITVKDLQAIDFPSAGSLKVNNLQVDKLRLVLSGAGDVDLIGLKAGSIDSTLSGAGDIKAAGTVSEMRVEISGFGSFKAADLQAATATVKISGAGDAVVRVSKELHAIITGAGSIDYYGSPSVDQEISGAGSVKPARD
jgi:hypothetical protein